MPESPLGDFTLLILIEGIPGYLTPTFSKEPNVPCDFRPSSEWGNKGLQ